ncbi:MAG: hypothetical protein BroJett031_19750 [Betaproteobacteria bacterium]|nr:MAG: hypothetical protein BroJett031_19750 [Betaproteobacteria bacterium]
MAELMLIAEDDAQERLVGALVQRIVREEGHPVALRVRSNFGGLPMVLKELRSFARQVERGLIDPPDLVVVALDANCHGAESRRQSIDEQAGEALRDRLIRAVPDPHIERWYLLDGAAFKTVLGQGCGAPDLKCEKDRYKRLLNDAIRAAGVEPLLGGVEYAEDLAANIDLRRAGRSDAAFEAFVSEMRASARRLGR